MKFIHKISLVLLSLQTLAAHATTMVTNIVAGSDYSFFIKSDSTLWAMGENTDGQLGDGAFILPNGPYSGTNKPEQIASNVVIAAAGVSDPDSHSLFIKSDGSLWGMGQNDQGQLGDGTFNSTNKPEQ